MSSAEGMKIKSTFPMSVTPVCPFMIPIPNQKCLHIATICPISLIFCKIVPSSKVSIFCLKLQLFLHFHQCMHAREQLHCRGTYLAHGIKPKKKYKKRTSVSYWLLYVKSTVWSSDIKHYRSNISRCLFCFKYYPNFKCDLQIFVQFFL